MIQKNNLNKKLSNQVRFQYIENIFILKYPKLRNMRYLVLLPIILLVIVYPPNACAIDYYVSPAGDDSGTGTSESPFATVQKAHDTASAGDRIILRGGTYIPDDRTRFTKTGTSDDFFHIEVYPGESVLIDGTDIPPGDTEGQSTPTWQFNHAGYWKVTGPIHLTNGRGAGVIIEDSSNIMMERIESSYNGKMAARAGHGFMVWDTDNLLLKNCDAHHNANHRWKTGESQAENQYQHGDGFRIFEGNNIKLVGCRGWHNLDDAFDSTQASDPIEFIDSWGAYSGKDDSQGSITGTPGFSLAGPNVNREGFRIGYEDDPASHRLIGCIAWNNAGNGYHMGQGPRVIQHSISFGNEGHAFRYYYSWKDLYQMHHYLQNNWEFNNGQTGFLPYEPDSNHNSWDASSGFSADAQDFISQDETGMLGPRQADGSLPKTDFFRLEDGSDLIDAGTFINRTASAGSGTSIQLHDARFFYGRHPLDPSPGSGAIIQLEGQTKRAEVLSVNYNTGTLSLNTSLTWSSGQGVAYAYEGSAPDIGAFEYGSTIICDISVHDADNNPCDGTVSDTELLAYISLWKSGYALIQDLIAAVMLWKG